MDVCPTLQTSTLADDDEEEEVEVEDFEDDDGHPCKLPLKTSWQDHASKH